MNNIVGISLEDNIVNDNIRYFMHTEVIHNEDYYLNNYIKVKNANDDFIVKVFKEILGCANKIKDQVKELLIYFCEYFIENGVVENKDLFNDPFGFYSEKESTYESLMNIIKKDDFEDSISCRFFQNELDLNTDEIIELSIKYFESKGEEFIALDYFKDKILNVKNYMVFYNIRLSITGGYVRNLLFNTYDKNTDIDIIINSLPYYEGPHETLFEYITKKIFNKTINRDNRNSVECTIKEDIFDIIDVDLTDEQRNFIVGNKIHFIQLTESPTLPVINVLYNFKKTPKNERRMLLNPSTFDFTINTACISLIDGFVYATPNTIYDINNNILRATNTIYSESKKASQSTIIRMFRFAHKYNLSIDKNTYISYLRTNKLYTALNAANIELINKAIKTILKEEESLKEKIYKNLQEIKFFKTEEFSNINSYSTFIENILQKYMDEKDEYVLADELVQGNTGY